MMPGQPSGPFDWSQYLVLAQELVFRPEDFCLRTSLTRAYYYIFHLALTRAKKNGYVPLRGEPSHAQLWRIYNDNPDSNCIRLSQLGLRLKRHRDRADYEEFFPRLKEAAEQALVDAQRFTQELMSLDSRQPNPKAVRFKP